MPRFRAPRRSEKKLERPSAFFVIALLVGILLLAWGAVVFVRTPVQP